MALQISTQDFSNERFSTTRPKDQHITEKSRKVRVEGVEVTKGTFFLSKCRNFISRILMEIHPPQIARLKEKLLFCQGKRQKRLLLSDIS